MFVSKGQNAVTHKHLRPLKHKLELEDIKASVRYSALIVPTHIRLPLNPHLHRPKYSSVGLSPTLPALDKPLFQGYFRQWKIYLVSYSPACFLRISREDCCDYFTEQQLDDDGKLDVDRKCMPIYYFSVRIKRYPCGHPSIHHPKRWRSKMTFIRSVLVLLLLWRIADLIGWVQGKRNQELTVYVLDIFFRAVVAILLGKIMFG